jgi:hypothetical protein
MVDRAEAIVLESMNAWFESVRFVCEVQGVISMRLMYMAHGGPQAIAEARLMVAEKIDAFTDAEVALARALSHGDGLAVAVERAYAPVRNRVHANNDRLLHAIG